MNPIPKHVGFIVDGNRRWAKEHSLPTLKGHTRGYELLKEVSLELLGFGVEVVSAYVSLWKTGSAAKKKCRTL